MKVSGYGVLLAVYWLIYLTEQEWLLIFAFILCPFSLNYLKVMEFDTALVQVSGLVGVVLYMMGRFDLTTVVLYPITLAYGLFAVVHFFDMIMGGTGI